jgi:hypothetical protein
MAAANSHRAQATAFIVASFEIAWILRRPSLTTHAKTVTATATSTDHQRLSSCERRPK